MSYVTLLRDATIGVCSRSFSKNQDLCQLLDASFPNVSYNTGPSSLSGQGLINFLQDKSVAILGLENITSNVLDSCTNLKVICKMGTGTDKIDLITLRKRGIDFYNTPGFNKYAVSELILFHALTLVRRLKENIDNVAKGQWKQQIGGELRGKCLGLLGFGAIGQEVARVFSVLGCDIISYDVNAEQIEKTQYVNLVSREELFSRSDIISINIPLLERTMNIVNSKLIDSMKKGSILINTSRGEVVDQVALVDRLKKGEINAGLDVLHNEPEVDFSLTKLPNVLITPHIGGSTDVSIVNNGKAIIKHLEMLVVNSVSV